MNELLVNTLHAGGVGPALSHAERHRAIRDRIVLLMVNEAFRAVEEQAITSGGQLDLALMLTDWAPHRGGPIRFAEREGLTKIVAELRRLEPLGERYALTESLVRGAGAKRGGVVALAPGLEPAQTSNRDSSAIFLTRVTRPLNCGHPCSLRRPAESRRCPRRKSEFTI